MSALSATAEAFGFWRKVRFLGQNPRIGYQKCNDLRTAKLSKKQLCDRIAVCALAYPLEVNRGKMVRRHTRKCRAKSAGPPLDLPSPSSSPPRATPAAFKQRSAAPAAPAARPQPPVLAVPGGAGLWPAGGRQGWPAAGVGRLRYALARPAPGGQRGVCGPTPSAGTSGSTVAGGGRTGAGRNA
jgi:hypothetical protein